MNKTKKRILELAGQAGGVRPHTLTTELNISNVAVHKHLRALLKDKLIERKGSPPHVIYVTRTLTNKVEVFEELENYREQLEKYFCYFTPSGEELHGVEAFAAFLTRTQQQSSPKERAQEYLKIVDQAEQFRDDSGLIDGTPKLKTTFNKCYVNKLFYSDFYSLPKYGKSKLGQYLLHGKSGQNLRLIKEIASSTSAHVNHIISEFNIDSVAFVPHSIPRKYPFLKEYKKLLKLPLPEIALLKGFSGDAPIAQKSLSKLSERIENARETIFLKEPFHSFGNTLLIDDALGSGATINEVSKKLIDTSKQPEKYNVFGYAIVGSYKGFEVIKEV